MFKLKSLWLKGANAYVEGNKHYLYSKVQPAILTNIDPYFAIHTSYRSRCLAYSAEENVISVDHQGIIRRCHVIKKTLGNIYRASW